tara:strand:+ start:1119 stop:1481 length:363 start_codon:yes stop_codon:yes gene_type:complete
MFLKNLNHIKNKKMYIIFLLIIFIFVTPIYDIIMYHFNTFERTITIKYVSHFLRYSLKKRYFKDENGIKYKWDNSFLFGKHNAVTEEKKLKVGNQVKIKGYVLNYFGISFLKTNIVYDIS